MNICSDNHDEVCYEGRDCPACKLYQETVELTQKIEARDDTISQLEGDIENLQAELKEKE
jgi:hypothetical protein